VPTLADREKVGNTPQMGAMKNGKTIFVKKNT
jgi:hypothetical protein